MQQSVCSVWKFVFIVCAVFSRFAVLVGFMFPGGWTIGGEDVSGFIARVAMACFLQHAIEHKRTNFYSKSVFVIKYFVD